LTVWQQFGATVFAQIHQPVVVPSEPIPTDPPDDGGDGGPCDPAQDPCCNDPDPCCGSSDPCCASSDPCCGNPDPCCGSSDPCCGVVCDDGDPCTDDSCAGGNCINTPKNCDDQDPCTTDECNPATGDCIHTEIDHPDDLDCDGIHNDLDPDDDGDGIPDDQDPDDDNDGIPDDEDPDDNNDGIPDVIDGDLDDDGKVDGEDDDLDGDGAPNDEDDDTDGDGIPNDQDDDDDGDGIPDDDDATPLGCTDDCPQLADLDGDSDHDGSISYCPDSYCAEEAVEEDWPGIIVLCNVDDGNNNQTLDNEGIDGGVVNEGESWLYPDRGTMGQMTQLVIDPISTGPDWSVTLKLHSAENIEGNDAGSVIRVAAQGSESSPEGATVLGPGGIDTPTVFRVPLSSSDHLLTLSELQSRFVVLHVEGLAFGASVVMQIDVHDPLGTLKGRDRVRITVAPFLCLPNTIAGRRAIVSNQDANFYGSISALFSVYPEKLITIDGVNDVWAQDPWEIGVSTRPAWTGDEPETPGCYDAMPIAMQTLRKGRPLQGNPAAGIQGWDEEFLLGPADATGLHTGLIWRQSETVNSDNDFAYGGNLEVTPPLPNNPLGRIVVGTDMPQVQKDFFIRQGVQTPLIELGTSWLAVGHIDEFMAFAPNSTGTGWRLVLANPDLAFQLLATADAHLPLFYCDEDAEWQFGEATGGTVSTLVDENPGVDFTTGAWQYILIYEGRGEHQIGEIDSVTANTITVARSWRFINADALYAGITGDSTAFEFFWEGGWRLEGVPEGPDGPAGVASQYVLVSCSKEWLDDEFPANAFPACTTVWEFRHPDNEFLRDWNADAMNRIATTPLFDELAGATYDLSFVPAIYIGDPAAGQAFAYVPGLVNFQVWRPWTTSPFWCDSDAPGPAQVWLPKPLGPRVGGVDLFEQAAANEISVPGGVFFIDDWDTYHRAGSGHGGEVHCGTNVVRVPTTSDPHARWWEHVTP
jgi:hypothetical protein